MFMDVVNIAARLEAHCEPGQILVSRIVREQVQKRVGFAIQRPAADL